jgi:hypothetical protein
MYSPKIKDDLIPILYKKAKLKDKTMTDIVDDLLRSQLTEDDTANYSCCSCRMPVDTVEEGKGYCDHCECIVFVEKS